MANTILGIFTALALLAAAYIGNKNSEKYTEEIANRQEKEATRTKLQATKKRTLDDRDSTNLKRTEQEGQARQKGEEVVDQENKVTAIKKEIEEKSQTIASQKQQIDAIKEQLTKHGDVKELVAKLRRMRDELEKLKTDIEAANVKLANLTSEKNRTSAVIVDYKTENDWRSRTLSNPNLKTKISGIFSQYGFVTLTSGNNAGVVGGSVLNVVRDGKTVAKLLVKSVETSTAAAELIPDSIAGDTVLAVGDNVESAKDETPKVEPKSTVAPAPAPAIQVAPAPLADPFQ